MPSVRGNSFRTINRWVVKRLGQERHAQFVKEMKRSVAQTLTEAEARLWYPLEHLTAIYAHIVSGIGNGDKSVLEDLGGFLAEVDLGGILKPIVAFLSISRALTRTPYLWPRYDDSGDFRVLSIDKDSKRAELELADYEGGPLHCVIIRSWLKRGCELIGAKNVEVREIRCRWDDGGDACRWEIKWQ